MKSGERKIYYFSFNTTVTVGIILFISCSIINQSIEINNNGSFSIEHIHRDSPLLNPKLSHFESQQIAFQRIAPSDLINDKGLYLMKIWYGTPLIELLHVVIFHEDNACLVFIATHRNTNL